MIQIPLALRTYGCAVGVGIDIHPMIVRVLILSRSRLKPRTLRIEHMGTDVLPENAMNGAEFVDPEAIATALAHAISADFRAAAQRKNTQVAMALPPCAVMQFQASIAALTAATALSAPLTPPSLDALEPPVLAECERMLGLETAELSADWQCAAPAPLSDTLTIVATPRRYTDMRLEAAARVGLRLNTVDLEAAAALRACCFIAGRQTGAQCVDQQYGAAWIQPQGIQIWIVRASRIQYAQFIARARLSNTDWIDALCAMTQAAQPGYALVAGTLDTFSTAQQTLAWIGQALRCPARPLDLAACCTLCPDACASRAEYTDAAFAVAFGLAVRGVFS